MKKIICSVIALCSILLFCCACNDSYSEHKNRRVGDSLAHTIGIRLIIENDEGFYVSSDDDDIELSVEKSYLLEIDILRTGGSTPGYIEKQYMEFDYDEEVINLIECNPEISIDYYYEIVCIKTDFPATIKVSTNSFSDEITFKFIN